MISQSGLLCNSLSFRGLLPQRLMRPSPGGNAGFGGCAPPNPRVLMGPPRPRPGCLSPGLTQPRAPGFTFLRKKVKRKNANPPWA